MGSQHSKMQISLPPKNRRCFPAFENETEIYETARQIEDCHLQAVKLASWLVSMLASPYSTTGQLAFTAATVLFTFLIHRSTSDLARNVNTDELCNNNSDAIKENPSTSLEDALIDSKVSAAIAKKSVCEFKAKLHVIENRWIRLQSNISSEERRLEVVPALQTCEEVLQLFYDPTHVFRLNPLASSPYLVCFAGVFVSVAELSLALIPTYNCHLVREISLLRETLSIYRTSCVEFRMNEIKFRRQLPGSMLDVVAAGMAAEMNYTLIDTYMEENQKEGENPTEANANETDDEEEDEGDRVYNSVNEAVAAFRNELDKHYGNFFEEALRATFNFSGFGNSTSKNEYIRENTSQVNTSQINTSESNTSPGTSGQENADQEN